MMTFFPDDNRPTNHTNYEDEREKKKESFKAMKRNLKKQNKKIKKGMLCTRCLIVSDVRDLRKTRHRPLAQWRLRGGSEITDRQAVRQIACFALYDAFAKMSS